MPDTLASIIDEINDEYDLTDEIFTNEEELIGYANEAVEDIEKEIHTINDKYFEAEEYLAIVSGTASYDPPTTIYANKITGVYFNDGSNKYEVKPIKDLSIIDDIEAGDAYRYRIVNNAATGTKIKLYPTPVFTSSSTIRVHFLRNATKFEDTADELDIPEAKSFIKQFIVDKVVNKERMTPDAPESAALGRKRKALLDSLQTMRPDENNEIPADVSSYCDQVGSDDFLD
jgi:hypothetical protein